MLARITVLVRQRADTETVLKLLDSLSFERGEQPATRWRAAEAASLGRGRARWPVFRPKSHVELS